MGELDWMRTAIEAGRNSQAKPGRTSPAPKVGAVLVRDGAILGTAFRGELDGPDDHAEFVLLEKKLAGIDLSGATLYTTLEPCSRRSPTKTPCANRIVDRAVGEVVVGIYDPNPAIYRQGWRILRDAGIRLRDFPAQLRLEIEASNAAFLDVFRESSGDEGVTAPFDYTQRDGRYLVRTSIGVFEQKWAPIGAQAVQVYGISGPAGPARYASEFSEIDDPGALDLSRAWVRAGIGDIVVLSRPQGYLLTNVVHVLSGPRWGHTHHELQFKFQVRALAAAG